jgi:hypothetical protein
MTSHNLLSAIMVWTCRGWSSQPRDDGTYALGGATCVLQPQQPIIWWQGVPEKCIEFIGQHQRRGDDEVHVAGREGYAYRPFWVSSSKG